MCHAGRRCSDLRAGRPLYFPRGAPRGTRSAMRVMQSILPRQRMAPRAWPGAAGTPGRPAPAPRGGPKCQLPVSRRHARAGWRCRLLPAGSGTQCKFRGLLGRGVQVLRVPRLPLRWRWHPPFEPEDPSPLVDELPPLQKLGEEPPGPPRAGVARELRAPRARGLPRRRGSAVWPPRRRPLPPASRVPQLRWPRPPLRWRPRLPLRRPPEGVATGVVLTPADPPRRAA